MSTIGEKQTNYKKRWILIGITFSITFFVFTLLDNTGYEPKINDRDNFFYNTFRAILDSKLFTQSFTPFSYPFFNMCLLLFIATIIFQSVVDLIVYQKNKNEGIE